MREGSSQPPPGSLVLATANAHKLREVSRLLAPAGIAVRGATRRHRVAARGRRDVRLQRAAEGARGCRGDGPAGDRGRLGDRGRGARRRSRRALGALRRSRRERRGEPREADARGACRKRAAVRVCAGVRRSGACGSRRCSSASAGDGWRTRGAARAGSATTRRSCRMKTAQGRTMAELSDEEKDEISHRGRAVRALAAWLSG